MPVLVFTDGHTLRCAEAPAVPVVVYCRWGHHERLALCGRHERMARDGRGRCRECQRDGYTSPVTTTSSPRPGVR